MSLKNWLFGSEEPGTERPASPPAETKTRPTKSAQPTESDSAPPKEPKPPQSAKDADKESPSPITDPAPEKAKTEETPEPKAEAKEDSKSKAQSAEKPADEGRIEPIPPPAPPIIKAATWKTLPVAEPWAPEAVANAFPELARHNYADHEAAERILPGGWRLLGASRRGRKQAHDARFREDAMAYGALPEVAVLSVADGAGSSKFSRIGSHVAAHETVARILEAVGKLPTADRNDAKKTEAALKSLLTDAVKAARQRVIEVAEKAELSPKEFRATLLTVIHWCGDERELLISNQVGDGAIAVLHSDKSIRKFGDSDSGAFSGEVSCFLTDAEADEKAAEVQTIDDVKDVEALFLCSDGIEDPFYPIDKKALDIFRQWHTGVSEPLDGFKSQPTQEAMFGEEAAAGELARWLEFEKRGENDDRTVMLLHRLPIRVKF